MDFDVPQKDMGRAGVIIQFSVEAKLDRAASALAGRPVMKDVEYIRIMTPGSSNNVVHRPVEPKDLESYGAQYERWQKSKENPVVGQPLREWPPLRPSEVATLVHNNVRTVEELAEVSDSNLQRIGPGFTELRQRARDFIKAAKDEGHIASIRTELEEARAHLAATRKQLDEVQAELRAIKPAGVDAKAVEPPRARRG
jgi:hypothetical protein